MSSIRIALLSIILAPSVHAADLAAIERKIGKEPAYAGKPKYCLLVFGPEATTRIWLALDGDKLYVDRNGNGDLTDDGPPVVARMEGEGDQALRTFTVPELRAGDRTHKQLRFSVDSLKGYVELFPEAKHVLKNDSDAWAYRIGIDIEIPGRKGNGIGGRITHVVPLTDAAGFLQLSSTPREAPIIHFGGPWSITFYSQDDLLIGRDSDLILAIGTPGVGVGTTAFVAYEGLVPEGLNPVAEWTYPSKVPGGPPIKDKVELKDRC